MSRIRIGVRRTAYALFIVAVAVAAFIWRRPLIEVWDGKGWTLVIATMFMALSILLQTRNFMAFLGPRTGLSLWPLSRLWAITALVNYLGPFQPGVALRVAYLSKRGIHWSESVLATWRQLCASIWISIAGCGLGMLTMDISSFHVLGWIFIAAFLLIPFVKNGILVLLGRAKRPAWLVARRGVLLDALRGIGASGITGVAAQYVVGTALLWFVYRAFGAPIQVGHALLLACMVYVSSLVALLPGNLGILDAIYVFGGHGAGLTLTQSAALALLLRCAQIVAAIGMAVAGPPPGGNDKVIPPDA